MKILTQEGETNAEENGSIADGDEDKESVSSETKTIESGENQYNGDPTLKRKYVHHIPLPSEIKTRGAKLPKYSFERKTHKKIPVQDKHHTHNKPVSRGSFNMTHLYVTIGLINYQLHV